jgi:hypothetical protein
VANPENLNPPWPKGQSGNPAGYSAGRRLADKLNKALEAEGLSDAVIRVFLGAALGDKRLLRDNTPQFPFFKELLDRTMGKIRDVPDDDNGPPEQPKDGHGNPIED